MALGACIEFAPPTAQYLAEKLTHQYAILDNSLDVVPGFPLSMFKNRMPAAFDACDHAPGGSFPVLTIRALKVLPRVSHLAGDGNSNYPQQKTFKLLRYTNYATGCLFFSFSLHSVRMSSLY